MSLIFDMILFVLMCLRLLCLVPGDRLFIIAKTEMEYFVPVRF